MTCLLHHLPRVLPVVSLLILANLQAAFGQGFAYSYPPGTSNCRDVVESGDGGFFMAGSIAADSALFLQKVDAQGLSVWTHHLHLNGARAIATCRAADGGFAVLAEQYRDTLGHNRNLVLKLSSDGSLLWQTELPQPYMANGLKDILTAPDGGFVAAGNRRDSTLAQNIWLVKLDDTGTLLWSKEFGQSDVNEGICAMALFPNGDLAIGGNTQGPNADLFLAKTDLNGNLLWENIFIKPANQTAYDLAIAPNGDLTLLAETYQVSPMRVTLLKTDSDGNQQWYRLMNPTNAVSDAVWVRSLTADPNGNLYVPIGVTTSNLDFSLRLYKFDLSGDTLASYEVLFSSGLLPWKTLLAGDTAVVIGGGSDIGGEAFLMKPYGAGIFPSIVNGFVHHDQDDDCTLDAGEPGLAQFLVKASRTDGSFFYAQTNASGHYQLLLPPGDYTLTSDPIGGNNGFWQACDTPAVTVADYDLTLNGPTLMVRSVIDCPVLEVEISSSFLRRCSVTYYSVYYCNTGTQTAEDATVTVVTDPLLTYVQSNLAPIAQNGDTLVFAVGDLSPGSCGDFWIDYTLSCDAEMGQSICAEAHIYPDTSCLPSDSLWDGSHLLVTGTCLGDTVAFEVLNTSHSPMAGTVDFVIIEDVVVYMVAPLQLGAEEDTIIYVPNIAGLAYYFRAPQRPGHPGKSHPTALVENCNGVTANSLALQLPLDEDDPFVAIDCDVVVSSFDPNDKRGFPQGWQSEHFIDRGQELDYKIRFQNTGTDTAFQVVIRDTLPASLDPATFLPGPASHPYTWRLEGAGVATFTFEDILLPDSTVNEPASHGFVSFHIAQQAGLPLSTLIENRAAIYFDFNAPVMTNMAFHTLGQIIFTVDPPTQSGVPLRVFPNPAQGPAHFQLLGWTSDKAVRLTVCDATGRVVKAARFYGPDFLLETSGLDSGLYFFRLESAGKRLASGKLLVE